MVEPADGELVRLARLGDPSAFQRLVDLYAPIAWRTALVFLKDRHLARRLAGAATVSGWRTIPSLAGDPRREPLP
jgi:hypothetical protein